MEDDVELPELLTEEGRDQWIEILMAEDPTDTDAWCKAVIVADDQGNMVARFVYADGKEEVFDLQVRRNIEVSASVEVRN